MPMTIIPETHSISKRQDIFCLLGICVLAVCIMLPALLQGVPKGDDMPQHLQFTLTVYDSIMAGDLYPAWMENENHGYGGVGMRFYPPVAYYVLAAGRMAAGSWYFAICFVFCFWLALSGVGAYLWCRERFGPAAALAGAVVFVAAPYHVNQVYNAFTYAEFAATAFLPFCFLFADRLSREAKFFNFAGLGIAYSMLVLTNLPVAVIGTFALGVYTLASLPRQGAIRTLLRFGGAYALGAALSSFYWIKVLTEMSWINHSTDTYSSGSELYNYRTHFLLRTKYFAAIGVDLQFLNLLLMYTLFLGVPLAVVYYLSTRSFAEKKLNRVWITLLFAVFMTTYLSVPAWDSISLLQKIQFPWRWLSIISLLGAPLAAAGWPYCMKWLRDKRRPYALIVLGLVVFALSFMVSQIIRPVVTIPREPFEENIASLGGENNFECWLPVWAKPEATLDQQKIAAGARALDGLQWKRKERSFTAAAGDEVNVRLATFYYPYWQVSINGVKAGTAPGPDGALTFDLPPQEAKVDVRFVEPFKVRLAAYISLALWGIVLLLLAFKQMGSMWRGTANAGPLSEIDFPA